MRLNEDEIPYRRKPHRAALTTDWGAAARSRQEEDGEPRASIPEVAAQACGLVYRHPYYLTPVPVAILQRDRTVVPSACLLNRFQDEPPRAPSERRKRSKQEEKRKKKR